eukprot:753861-Hanusia_phi.AAC.4
MEQRVTFIEVDLFLSIGSAQTERQDEQNDDTPAHSGTACEVQERDPQVGGVMNRGRKGWRLDSIYWGG